MHKKIKVGEMVVDQVCNEEGVVTKVDGNTIELFFEDSDVTIVFHSINDMNDWLIGKL